MRLSWPTTPRVRFVEPPFDKLHPVNSHGSLQMDRGGLDNPQMPVQIAFRRHDKSTNIELFYDLFFVANLTVFTNVHDISSKESLVQYIGFFCLIWFTWYQVTLYDTRFAMDSIFERIAKAVQLLAMMGFAACGPKFNPGKEQDGEDDFEGGNPVTGGQYFSAITIFLMVSRLVLVAQYIQTALLIRTRAGWNAPRVHGIVLSLGLTALAYFVTAMVYLGLFWTFPTTGSKTYIVWYVMAVLETIVVSALSVTYRSISFGETHLVERMSLLTLIILGEGAIAAAKECQAVINANSELQRVGSAAAMMFCAVIYLYCLYLIYFNCIQREHFQGLWQQVWAHLHFPLHIALVLAVEGASQCITWQSAVAAANNLSDGPFQRWTTLQNSSSFNELARDVNETAQAILSAEITTAKTFASTLDAISNLNQLKIAYLPTIAAGGANATAYNQSNAAISDLENILFGSLFAIAGFTDDKGSGSANEVLESLSVPMSFNVSGESSDSSLNGFGKSYTIFEVVSIYFLAATGAALILCAILGSISGGTKSRASWLQFSITAVIGLGVGLTATIEDSFMPSVNFNSSPWILPTAMLAVFLVVVVYTVDPVHTQEEEEQGGSIPEVETMVLHEQQSKA